MLPNKVYDVLKWVCIIALPAISTFYSTLGEYWGLPYVDKIPKTITAVAVLIGALIGISSVNYNKEK